MLMTASFLPSLVFSQTQVYSEPKGSRRCYAIKRAAEESLSRRQPFGLYCFQSHRKRRARRQQREAWTEGSYCSDDFWARPHSPLLKRFFTPSPLVRPS